MKQFKILTNEEWEELSPIQQEKLVNIYQTTFNKGVDFTGVGLSIGEMIEILIINAYDIFTARIYNTLSESTNIWVETELCDMLWESIKSDVI